MEEKNLTIEVYIKYTMPLFSLKKKKYTVNNECEPESDDEDDNIIDSSDKEELF